MSRRTGATLVEVLVTIFVMALGLIALLTLFPIGALRMAEALKDSRTALAAANAEAIAAARALRNDSAVTGATNNYRRPQGTPADAPLDGPSYPMYLDPIGVRHYSSAPNNLSNWVGGTSTYGQWIRRVKPAFIVNANPVIEIQRTLSNFSLLDDITFGQDGVPIDANGRRFGQAGFSNVQREGAYTWGLMMKRPRTSTPSVVDMTVVVYQKRPHQLGGGLNGLPFGETSYAAESGAERGNTLRLTWTSPAEEAPKIKKGSWILDGTAYNFAHPNLTQPQRQQLLAQVLKHGPVHGYFYRVTNIAAQSGNTMDLQLETPLKADINPIAGLPQGAHVPRVIVMDYVAEVFEKGPGWLP